MTSLTDLAAKVEALSGACRETDAEIWRLMPDIDSGADKTGSSYYAPRFTTSLDAAMALVPNGWRNNSSDSSIENRTRWMLKRSAAGSDAWHKRRRDREDQGLPEDDSDDLYINGVGATPALALTAAALRARASMESGQ